MPVASVLSFQYSWMEVDVDTSTILHAVFASVTIDGETVSPLQIIRGECLRAAIIDGCRH